MATLALAVLLFGGYLVLGLISYQGALPPYGIPAFFFANGLSTVFLLRSRRAVWPIFLLATFAADALVNHISGFGLAATFLWAAGDTAETLVGAWLLRLTVGQGVALERTREVAWFAAITFLIAPIVTVPFALLSVLWVPDVTYSEVQASWWPTGGLGTFAIGAVAVAWSGPRWRRVGGWRALSILLMAAMITAFFLLVFRSKNIPASVVLVAFTAFPLMTVSALVFGPRGASLTALGIGAAAVWATLAGEGLFAELATASVRLLSVQAFFALATLSVMVLAAVTEERRRAVRGQSLLLQVATGLGRQEPLADRLNELVGFLVPGVAAGAAVGLRTRGAKCEPIAIRAADARCDRELLEAVKEIAPSLEKDTQVDGTTILPLHAHGDRVGTLALVSTMGNRLDEQDRDLASTIARQLEAALEADRLRSEAEHHAREIESSEKRFRSLAEATAEVLWVTDAKGGLIGAQPSWEAFTGQTPAQYLGFGWLDAIHPDFRASAKEIWRQALSTGRPIHAESRVRRKDGAWVYMETSAGPVRDSEGRIREWVGMNVDISDRKAAEAERGRLLQAAQEAIQVRDDFLSIASHELKTPLTPLSTWLQLVQRRITAGQQVDPSWLIKARNSLDRLAALINDLLDASRVQSKRLTVRFERVSLSDVVIEQVAAAETLSEKHEFFTKVPDWPVCVMGERARLEQVLANLLENAIKYSPRGGPIRVELRTEADEALLAVTDSGVGIPKDQLTLLFDRFFRARNISTRSYGGLGLGLYIVRDILDHHGGRIWVESELGVGSTFTVALPLTDGQALAPHADVH